MKKFTFELDKVLEYRNFEKKQAEAELAKALAVESEIQNNLDTIAKQYISLKNYMKGSTDFYDMISMNQNIKLLDYQKEELLKQLAEAKLVSDEKRKVLQECMKKTTALERMEEIKREEYKEEVRKTEKKQTETLASLKSSEKVSSENNS